VHVRSTPSGINATQTEVLTYSYKMVYVSQKARLTTVPQTAVIQGRLSHLRLLNIFMC